MVVVVFARGKPSTLLLLRPRATGLRVAGEKPVAILSHNRPAFYMVTPKIFEAFVETLADRELAELIRHRIAQKDQAVEVDIDTV